MSEINQSPVSRRVGSTSTAISVRVGISTTSTRTFSANCLRQTLNIVCALGVVLRKTTVNLVETLIVPFCARLSKCKDGRMTQKEFGRMCRSFAITATNIDTYWDERDGDMTFVKTHFQILQAKCFGRLCRIKRPERPLFVGWLKRFVHRRMNRRETGFIQSLAQAKKVWRPIGKVRREEAFEEHRQLLCCRAPQSLEPWIGREIEMTAQEVLNINLGPPIKMLPSNHSCLQTPRLFGGVSNNFERLRLSGMDGESPWEIDEAAQRQRQEWYWYARATIDENRRYLQEEQARVDGFASAEIKTSNELARINRAGSLDVEVIAIPEPCKVRLITKGDAYTYVALQPPQGQLLSAWKRCPANTMTQDPDIEVQRILDNTISEREWKWISVDYTSATDYLEIESTMRVIHACTNLVDHQFCIESLECGGNVRYSKGAPESCKQWKNKRINGQLMGHPLSFPILCTINEACVRATCKLCVREGILTTHQARLIIDNHLVNGDDLLMRGPIAFNKLFKEISTSVGLVYNVDKSFVSKDTALINSQLYLQRNSKMVRKGFLNQKLVAGNNLSGPEQQSPKLNQMIEQCPWTQSCLPIALERWSEGWRGSYRPNWFLPICLGGYGFNPRFARDDIKVTRSQRKMAAMQVADPKISYWINTSGYKSTFKYKNYQPHWRLSHEEEFDQDPNADAWVERAMLHEKMSWVFHDRSDAYDTVGGLKVHRKWQGLKLKSHLKPMSWKAMIKWWSSKLICDAMPQCPPLQEIRTRSRLLYAERKRSDDFTRLQIKKYGPNLIKFDRYGMNYL